MFDCCFKRAKDYRKLYKIPDTLGTAVNIQTMVFGNKGDTSGTGVAFTRDAATGENEECGDYLINAQGEDVVAGIRNTEPISNLENELPDVYRELMRTLDILEKHYRDMCDTEFTIEQGKLYMLQTRVGKRTAAAALVFEADKAEEMGEKGGRRRTGREAVASPSGPADVGIQPDAGSARMPPGHRQPEIYKMQVRAIMEAGAELKAGGNNPVVEIMIPLVSLDEELRVLRGEAEAVCAEVLERTGQPVEYKIGTMIELPRAAVTADEIANHAEFFSFGTNDPTQTTFGFSRDDIEGKFLARYLDRKIMASNPFETIDAGVVKLVETACSLGRKTKPDIKLGVCGEHGGDPASVKHFHEIGLNYVSCSPYRVPLARLAAAQAALAKPMF